MGGSFSSSLIIDRGDNHEGKGTKDPIQCTLLTAQRDMDKILHIHPTKMKSGLVCTLELAQGFRVSNFKYYNCV